MKYSGIRKMLMLGAVMFSMNTGVANAALITGDMGVTGSYSTSGGSDLSDDTLLILGSVTGTSGSGDIGSMVGWGTSGSINNGVISLASFTTVTDVFTIGGWQLDLTSLSIVDQTADLLTLEGSGFLSGNAFDITGVNWTFSASAVGTSYSMTMTAVPVPAAVWLFGSGLLGLIGVARRKIS